MKIRDFYNNPDANISASQFQDLMSLEVIIEKNRLVADRLLECSQRAIKTESARMGSGGVGQVKVMQDGSIRVQISHGTGRWNYALVAVI
jgi:hypothetical protein